MVWHAAGVTKWKPGLALHNGFQWQSADVGRDLGDETRTKNSSSVDVEKARRWRFVVVVV